MKKVVITWELRRKFELGHTLADVEEQIHDLFLLAPTGVLLAEELAALAGLKGQKDKILALDAASSNNFLVPTEMRTPFGIW